MTFIALTPTGKKITALLSTVTVLHELHGFRRKPAGSLDVQLPDLDLGEVTQPGSTTPAPSDHGALQFSDEDGQTWVAEQLTFVERLEPGFNMDGAFGHHNEARVLQLALDASWTGKDAENATTALEAGRDQADPEAWDSLLDAALAHLNRLVPPGCAFTSTDGADWGVYPDDEDE